MNHNPIFKEIFGKDWHNLPPVMHKHYSNRPYSQDVTTVEGELDIMCAGFIKFLSPIFWLMRGIPPHNEKNVPVTVSFTSKKNTDFFYFKRIFHFKKRKIYEFQSHMIRISGNEMIEVMRSGLGWRLSYTWEDGCVKLNHKGYVFKLFGYYISLPLTFIIGSGYAEEVAIDDNRFDMVVTIIHPWWGKLYEYKGRFKIKENT